MDLKGQEILPFLFSFRICVVLICASVDEHAQGFVWSGLVAGLLTVVGGLCGWIDWLWLCDDCGLRFWYGGGNSDDCVLLLCDSSVLMGQF